MEGETSEELYEDEDNPDRRIQWQIFIATLVGMVLLTGAVIVLLLGIQKNHREDEISRRAKYDACSTMQNEVTRVVCLNRWG